MTRADSSTAASKLPVAAVAVLCAINFAEAIQGNLLWPFLPFAVIRWGAPAESAGVAVGLVASSFYLGQALSAWFWGRVADRVGRRPVLLIGVAASGVLMASFGFATTVPVACAVRFLGGLATGNVPTSKVYMGEVAPPAKLARAFSYLALTWGLGTAIAPAVGGWLADPVVQFPGAFTGVTLLVDYPYLLPSLVGSAWALVTAAVGYLLLPETPVFLRRRALAAESAAPTPAAPPLPAALRARSGFAIDDEESADDDDVDGIDDDRVPILPPVQAPAHAGESPGFRPPRRPREDKAGSSGATTSLGPSRALSTAIVAPAAAATATGAAATAAQTTPAAVPRRRHTARPPAIARGEAPATLCTLLADAPVRACMTTYGLLCCVQVIFDELLPVLASLSVRLGGFGFSAGEAGTMQVVSGTTQVAATLLAFPAVVRLLGARRLLRLSLLPLVAAVLFPFVHHAFALGGPDAGGSWPLYSVLAAALVVKTVAMSLAFSSVILLINNVGRGQHLAAITGLSQIVASTVRTIAPALGGAAFSESMALGDALGPTYALLLTYGLLSVAALATLAASSAVPAYCDASPDYDLVLDEAPAVAGAVAGADRSNAGAAAPPGIGRGGGGDGGGGRAAVAQADDVQNGSDSGGDSEDSLYGANEGAGASVATSR